MTVSMNLNPHEEGVLAGVSGLRESWSNPYHDYYESNNSRLWSDGYELGARLREHLDHPVLKVISYEGSAA